MWWCSILQVLEPNPRELGSGGLRTDLTPESRDGSLAVMLNKAKTSRPRPELRGRGRDQFLEVEAKTCLLYTSDAADE